MIDDEILHLIALNKVPLVGPILAKQLLAKFGNAREVFKAKPRDLICIPKIGQKIAKNICASNTLASAEKEMHLIQKHNIKYVAYYQEDYPFRLKQIFDAPLVLFYRGDLSLINKQKIISIVGTREPTEYGKNMLSKIIDELKVFNPTIISGLAYGIDTYAHRLALKASLATFGILGSGLKNIYPRSNYSLAQKMTTQGGLVTEFTYHSQAEREHFPMRNRIIAALCDALIVVESKKVGGSMITADFANQYNRDVFAIPGRVNDSQSEGPNFLIKTHRANLLNSATDISYVMGWDKVKNSKAQQQSLFIELNEEEKAIIDLLKSQPQISLDALALKANVSLSKLASITLNLEFKGIIRPLPGKRFTLI